MAKLIHEITTELKTFISKQRLFFVATAPMSETGHINLSPKGYDCFRILSPIKVAYLDMTGSGNETSAHLLENQRITFMFCAFEGAPKILRLYGKGHTALRDSDEWKSLILHFEDQAGSRQIIVADIDDVQTSCGFGIPIFDFVEQRPTLVDWAMKKGRREVEEYQVKNNSDSIDGLPTALKLGL